jgi:uncharacterized repeat protein (TIGR03803 family)
VLYQFTGGTDDAHPFAEVVFDKAGNLYGTTNFTVYELTPSQGGWTYSLLHSFTGGNDGEGAAAGLIFDNTGNLYGETCCGGQYGQGVVFQLTPQGSGWQENVLYSFQGSNDGGGPYTGGLIFDGSGNLYGATTAAGSGGGGTAFELVPSNGSWTYILLYSFTGLGGPWGSLVMDTAGNLYGTTYADGAHQYGSVFKLTPSNGNWVYTPLYDFKGGTDGKWPQSNVVFDANGNLYGTASAGGTGCAHGCGVVWEITP